MGDNSYFKDSAALGKSLRKGGLGARNGERVECRRTHHPVRRPLWTGTARSSDAYRRTHFRAR